MRIFGIARFDDFLADEQVYFIFRRHKFVYFSKVFKMTLFFAVLWALVIVEMIYGYVGIGFVTNLIIIIGLLLIYALYFWKLYIDWKYDRLIVTNQRIVYIDQHFIWGKDMKVINIDQIVNMNTKHSGWIQVMLGYGSMTIETSATIQSDCIISYICDPEEIVKIIHNVRNNPDFYKHSSEQVAKKLNNQVDM